MMPIEDPSHACMAGYGMLQRSYLYKMILKFQPLRFISDEMNLVLPWTMSLKC